MNDTHATLDRLVTRAGRLYTLPAVAMEVLELTANPRVDTQALKRCIENDPAMTTRILRTVNSSLFGLSREVCDLNQALALLGIKPLKLLVLGFSLPSELFAGIGSATLGYYWRHALTKAVAAREISESLWQQPGDEPFIAGLLQDLGVLVLLRELGTPYARFLDRVVATHGDLSTLEIGSLGFDHTVLSSRLLAHWGLPGPLVEAVGWMAQTESRPGKESPSRLVEVLHLAELLAQFLADGNREALAALLAAAVDHGLDKVHLETLVGRMEEKVRQLAEVLSLELPENLNYRDLLQQAHEQLSDVASEAAVELARARPAVLSTETASAALLDEFRDLTEAAARVVHGSPEPQGPASPAAGDQGLPSPRASCSRGDGGAAAPAKIRPLEKELPARRPGGPAVTLRPTTHSSAAVVESETDPGMLGQLTAAVTSCRQLRCPLSLLIIELDHWDDLLIRLGMEGFRQLRRMLEAACRNLDHPGIVCLPHGDAGFALILPDCDRKPVSQLGNELIEEVRRLAPARSSSGRAVVSISLGAATVSLPPKNFPAEDLLKAAARCLNGSRASGGSVVKSIEIY